MNNKEINKYVISQLDKSINVSGRKAIVNNLLNCDMCEHYTNLLDDFYANPDLKGDKRVNMIHAYIEHPLECIGSYLLGTVNSDDYLRRKLKDGQIRRTKDGQERKRMNTLLECELLRTNRDGDEYNLLESVPANELLSTDNYLLLINDENELLVASLLSEGLSMAEIERQTGLSIKKIKTLRDRILNNLLKWYKINEYSGDYQRLVKMIKRKFKNFRGKGLK